MRSHLPVFIVVATTVSLAATATTGFVVSPGARLQSAGPSLSSGDDRRHSRQALSLQQRAGSSLFTRRRAPQRSSRRGPQPLQMVWSGGQGFLGVGTPEVIVCCAVGYFLLGPKELYKLSKEIGKLVGQARDALAQSAAEWQSTMDAQFEFEELKDLQNSARELRDAFDFRSSRYMNEWRDYSGATATPPDPLGESKPASQLEAVNNGSLSPPSSSSEGANNKFQNQLDLDAWNAAVLARDGELPLPDPPVVDKPLADKKDLALQQLEREYQLKLRELQLEYDFKREKAQIDYATSEDEMPNQQTKTTSR